MSGFKDIDWRAQIFPKRDDLPADLTSYDYLKTLAVILMLIDHVGYYLFPDIEWFRAIGRASMPIWFFLIGFSRRQDLPNRWLIGGVVLLFANLLVGMNPLPLAVLFTLALSRLLVEPFWDWISTRPVYLWWVILLLMFFGPATDMAVEYGTFGFLFAACGYGLRHQAVMTEGFGGANPTDKLFPALTAVYCLYEVMKFGFSPLAAILACAGVFAVYWVLQGFESKAYPGTSDHPQAPLIRFMGRYTLEIYVIHLLILKAVFGLKNIAAAVL